MDCGSSTEGNSSAGMPMTSIPPHYHLLWMEIQADNFLEEGIKLADQKAGFFFAITTGLLALLYGKEVHYDLLTVSITNWTILSYVILLSTTLLLISTILSFFVIKPRRSSLKRDKLLYWEFAVQFKSAEEYARRMMLLNPDETIRELLQHNFDRLVICNRKYRILRHAMSTALAGMILSIISLIWK